MLSYEVSSGKIHLRYRPGTLGDFTLEGKKKAADAIHLHSAVFDGPYSIEIKGSRYPGLGEIVGSGGKANFAGSPTILAGVVEGESFAVVFGFPQESRGSEVRWLPSTISHASGGDSKDVDVEKTPQTRPGKPYTLRVSVSGSEVAAFYENRKILSARQPQPTYGQVGFCNVPEFAEIVLRGKVQPAWLQGLQDAATQAALAEFEKRYDPSADAPAWLLAESKGTPSAPEVADRTYPGPEGPERRAFYEEAMSFYREKAFEKGLAFLKESRDGRASEEILDYLHALFHWARKDFREVLVHCERVCERDPEFFESRRLRGYLYSVLGPREKAIEEYRNLLDRRPREATLYEDLARFLLEAGRPAEAKAIVERAAAGSVRTEKLERIEGVLVKAERGPDWSRRFTASSKNYEVFSDIDRDTCVEASKVLEDAYLAYTLHLRPIEGLDRRKFRVYLFSGKSSYDAYAADVFGAEPGRTAGMYSPALKQLLIWNLPDRDGMMRTVRHEGFHQYLDRLAEDPPVWLNEGLAECYELARVERGEWKTGQLHEGHLRRLREGEKEWIPLQRFFDVDRETFYGKRAPLHYAQGWAFVHFLRHADREKSRRFRILFEALAGGAAQEEAVDRAFAGLDLEKLEEEFRSYVRAVK